MDNNKDWFTEKALLMALEKREIRALIRLYKDYGEDLLIFTYTQVQDPQLAVQVVEKLFDILWAEANFEEISPPIHKCLVGELRKLCEQHLPKR
ncbi:MAG TPA: hypothetical protein VF939_11670 [Puia sp.]